MKILYTLIITFLSSIMTGQSESNFEEFPERDSIYQLIAKFENDGMQHFTFKGIPIDGSLNYFINKLVIKDFEIINTTKFDAILSGTFTGEEVNILVQSGYKNVFGVTVMFNEKSSWKSIKNQYENVKSILTSKYGKPVETIEKFDSPEYESLGMELIGLSEDKYNYYSAFTTPTGNGMIKLNISPDASLVLSYTDTLNFLLVSCEAYDEY